MSLYTKIKGPVNYTVIGNPTIENGIASRFSANNYLQLQQTFTLNKNSLIEFKIKINISTGSTGNGIIGYPEGYYFHLIIPTDNKISLYMGNGSNWTLLNGQKGTTVLSTNIDYYIKIIINKGNVKCFLSTDDITYTTEFDVNITITEEYNYNIVYGRARTDSQYLRGSIDLNNTYVNINCTTWFGSSFSKVRVCNQPSVSYTMVGNVNIDSNGIATGFTDVTDYLNITGAFSPGTHKWKFTTKVKIYAFTENKYMTIVDRTTTKRAFQININPDRVFETYISTNGTSKTKTGKGTYVFLENTIY